VQGRNVTLTDGSIIGLLIEGAAVGAGLSVNASESVQVIGRSADGQLGSALFASSDSDSTGDVGNLTITTSRLLISDGASVSAPNFGTGDGSNLTVNASESVQVIGTSPDGQFASRLSAQSAETSNAGNLTITTPALLIRDGALVSVATIGSGEGGNLRVNASESVQVIGRSADGELGSGLFADTIGTGKAGNLTIITPRLFILNGARVSAGTFGPGEGGDLIINASEEVQVIGTSTDSRVRSQLSSDTFSTGKAGNLTITTPRLLISDGARVTASTFGAGKAGNLRVNASQEVQVSGESADGQFPSNLLAQANENTTGDAGNLTIITGRLLILDGGQVSTGTFGAGKGGNLTVNTSQEVQVSGESTDARFSSALSVQTEGTGDAGNLTVTTPTLLVRDGAQVSAGTRSTGRGGDLIVNASQEVQLIGISADGQSSSGLFSSALFGATAGNLTITTRQMSVRDGARVTVSSPQGQAGSLSITADSLTLNRGTISAETAKSDAQGGANINLSSLELLRLDNESLISATALEDANGGNITIDSTLIVATPPTASEGSDITANAIQGNGGSVTITTQGLFGIEFRENRTPQNDITVSSEFGISGVFEQNTPGIDPSRGLAELPTDVVNAAAMIDRHCNPGEAAQRSTFVVTGRGGLPPNPNDTLQGEAVVTNWVTLYPQEENINSPNLDANPTNTAPKQLVEAQGWVYGSDGQVILVAQASTPTPESPWQTAPSCRDSDWR
jgi:large exoprotein involved in heme utilization and adhesion